MGIIKKKVIQNKSSIEVEEELYSATKIAVKNYNVYYLTKQEKTIYFILFFLIGGVVGYLFYGGIGKDEFGPTLLTYFCNLLSFVIVGSISGILFVPQVQKSKLEKRKKKLAKQFRDMLDALTTSLGAGKNVHDSFIAAREDLAIQYDEDADILYELDVIISELKNNISIEDLLDDFGKRSGIDDIKSFADVFKISHLKGGNIKDVIKNTHDILSDKMSISEEIETLVSANKFEQNIMIFMPILLVALMKFSSPDFAENFTSKSGLLSTTIAIVLFVVAYFLGKKILNIRM